MWRNAFIHAVLRRSNWWAHVLCCKCRLHHSYRLKFQVGQRVARCLSEFVWCSDSDFNTLVGATLLAKCFRAGLWEDSPYVSKQFEGVGIAYSTRWARLWILPSLNPVYFQSPLIQPNQIIFELRKVGPWMNSVVSFFTPTAPSALLRRDTIDDKPALLTFSGTHLFFHKILVHFK